MEVRAGEKQERRRTTRGNKKGLAMEVGDKERKEEEEETGRRRGIEMLREIFRSDAGEVRCSRMSIRNEIRKRVNKVWLQGG